MSEPALFGRDYASPEGLDGATALLGRYASLSAFRDRIEASRQSKLARINAAADAAIAPIVTELNNITTAMEPWWALSRQEILVGKKKSAEIGGCQIGNKASPAKVAFDFVNDDAAIDAIGEIRGAAKLLLKVKPSLDRPAILRMLGATSGMATALKKAGFRSVQDELFFITPLPSAPLGQLARSTLPAS